MDFRSANECRQIRRCFRNGSGHFLRGDFGFELPESNFLDRLQERYDEKYANERQRHVIDFEPCPLKSVCDKQAEGEQQRRAK